MEAGPSVTIVDGRVTAIDAVWDWASAANKKLTISGLVISDGNTYGYHASDSWGLTGKLVQVSSVPEPGGLALTMAGVAMLASASRRKLSSSAR